MKSIHTESAFCIAIIFIEITSGRFSRVYCYNYSVTFANWLLYKSL